MFVFAMSYVQLIPAIIFSTCYLVIVYFYTDRIVHNTPIDASMITNRILLILSFLVVAILIGCI